MVKTLFLLLIATSFEVIASYDTGRMAFDQGDFPRAYQLWLETAKGNTELVNNSLQWTKPSSVQQRNAQYAIAILYWQGKGVAQNYAQAAKWLKLAIESGHIKAQLKLGFLYLQGNGVDKDETEARKRFIIAADHGLIDAQFNLGMLYLMGIGGERNVSKAKYWLKQAALQGDAQAFEELMKFQENTNEKLLVNMDKKPNVAIRRIQTETPRLFKKIELHEPTWLLKQSQEKYAVQVLAMNTLQQLQEFTDVLQSQDDWAYFIKQKGKQKFYILLRCCFPNKIRANQFMQNFSSDKKHLQPFLINLKRILTFVKATD